ncbi:hypothetical protein PAHAL_2G266900 [Panicum hallii]|uniref:Uncharacterized protein n=1 Tax=Panicum hallii TaxID=206008 RepID=A0A2T8KQI8_9POAL|nr:hypothetical protein PAHAL_2G266900 [Panicum hallii]
MGWGGALDMVVLWLTEESEHAAAQTASEYGCFLRDERRRVDGWMPRRSCCCVLTSLSVSSLSSSGLVPPHPSPPSHFHHPSLIGARRCVVVQTFSHRSPWPCRLWRYCAAGLAVSPPAILSCLLLGFLRPALWNKVLLNFRQPPRACTPWILAPAAFLFSARLSLLSLWLPIMDY